jgi:hypothetical protein
MKWRSIPSPEHEEAVTIEEAYADEIPSTKGRCMIRHH